MERASLPHYSSYLPNCRSQHPKRDRRTIRLHAQSHLVLKKQTSDNWFLNRCGYNVRVPARFLTQVIAVLDNSHWFAASRCREAILTIMFRPRTKSKRTSATPQAK